MSPRSLLWILIALALSMAPVGIRNGAMAMASTPDHHSPSMQNRHCDEQTPKQHDGDASEKSCCIAMCTAIATTANQMVATPELVRAKDRPPLDRFHHGFLAKLPTPPPRAA
jgi:hypothetical protein